MADKRSRSGGGVAEEFAQSSTGGLAVRIRRGALVAPHDQLEKTFAHGVRQLPHAKIIDDEQWHGGKLGEAGFPRAGQGGVREFLEQREGVAIEDTMALLNLRVSDCLCEM